MFTRKFHPFSSTQVAEEPLSLTIISDFYYPVLGDAANLLI
ncbi:hypothetical protein MYEC719_p20123 (plasmid) [Escherichia coli]|nr:hypothetical protein MYEC719_p20123 [Escherichia coli]